MTVGTSNPDKHEQPINVNGSSVFGRYPKISGEKTYNMFNSDEWLVCLGGYQRELDLLPVGEGRGLFHSIRGDFMLAVVNANVYRISGTLGSQLIGSLASSLGEVFIDENLNSQICIVDGINAYIYNWTLPANLTIQADAHFGNDLIPNYVCYHDTFFLFGNALATGASASWFVYQFSAPTTIAFVSNQGFQTKPDYPLAVRRIPGQSSNVLVLGNAVCEVHTHIGSTINYQRNNAVSIDYGCLSVDTIAANDEYIAWLGVNESNAPVIMLFSGQKAVPISTDGIDHLMESLSHPEKSTALFFRQDGHLFYLLTFFFKGDNIDEADNLTLLYDLTNKRFYHASDQHLDYHPARQAVFFKQDTFFISLNNCSLYRWNSDITSIIEQTPPDFNVPNPPPLDPNLVYEMQRIRITQTFRAPKNTPFVSNSFNITIDQGNDDSPPFFDCLVLMITESTFPVFPNTRIFSENGIQVVPEGAGQDDCVGVAYRPKVQLALSKDGSVTWSNYVDKLLNPLGYRKNILKWDRLGLANEITFKLRFWATGRFVVTNGILTAFAAGRNTA